jgi:hypothetical protein
MVGVPSSKPRHSARSRRELWCARRLSEPEHRGDQRAQGSQRVALSGIERQYRGGGMGRYEDFFPRGLNAHVSETQRYPPPCIWPESLTGLQLAGIARALAWVLPRLAAVQIRPGYLIRLLGQHYLPKPACRSLGASGRLTHGTVRAELGNRQAGQRANAAPAAVPSLCIPNKLAGPVVRSAPALYPRHLKHL